MPLTKEEHDLVDKLTEINKWKDVKAEEIRRIEIQGTQVMGKYESNFETDLRLATIRASKWNYPEIYNLNDECGPVDYRSREEIASIDWSCIRDSSEEAVNEMFKIAKREILSK